ncbi:hypothetical protein Q5752_004011 [Cryptotrichosporon argae]
MPLPPEPLSILPDLRPPKSPKRFLAFMRDAAAATPPPVPRLSSLALAGITPGPAPPRPARPSSPHLSLFRAAPGVVSSRDDPDALPALPTRSRRASVAHPKTYPGSLAPRAPTQTPAPTKHTRVPSATLSSAQALGQGAQVVRTPQDAAAGMRRAPRVDDVGAVGPLSRRASVSARDASLRKSASQSALGSEAAAYAYATASRRESRPPALPALPHVSTLFSPGSEPRFASRDSLGAPGAAALAHAHARRPSADRRAALPPLPPPRAEPLGPIDETRERTVVVNERTGRRTTLNRPLPAPAAVVPATDTGTGLLSPPAKSAPEPLTNARFSLVQARALAATPTTTTARTGPASTAFNAVILSHTQRPAPTSASATLLTLQFAYDARAGPHRKPDTSAITLPLDVWRPFGGRIVGLAEAALEEEDEGPGMTDGSSASSSYGPDDEDAGALDEYMSSIGLASPAPAPARPITPQRPPRAATRNQYASAVRYPTPSGALAPPQPPLSARRGAPVAPIHVRGPGTLTEITVLVPRDAGVWHAIASRVATGSWSGDARARALDDLRWAGIDMDDGHRRSRAGYV